MASADGLPPCPECRVGQIELVVDGAIGEMYAPGGFITIGRPLPWRWKWVPFGACNGCEFCIEIDTRARAGLNHCHRDQRTGK
jgi:hypothetical protein